MTFPRFLFAQSFVMMQARACVIFLISLLVKIARIQGQPSNAPALQPSVVQYDLNITVDSRSPDCFLRSYSGQNRNIMSLHKVPLNSFVREYFALPGLIASSYDVIRNSVLSLIYHLDFNSLQAGHSCQWPVFQYDARSRAGADLGGESDSGAPVPFLENALKLFWVSRKI